MSLGMIGQKAGMTRIFDSAGISVPVTVISVTPNQITQIKTLDTDGYKAVQVSYGVKKESKTNAPTPGSIFLKATLLSLFFAFIMLLITSLFVLGFGFSKLNSFAKKADTSIPELKTLVSTGLKTQPQSTDGFKNILLLGVDTVANKPDSPQLTDTMLLISINLNSGNINTLSLPRDLWSTTFLF